jgi:hypothetical protein
MGDAVSVLIRTRPRATTVDSMGSATARIMALSRRCPRHQWSAPMSQTFDASRSLTALEQDSTIIAVIEITAS